MTKGHRAMAIPDGELFLMVYAPLQLLIVLVICYPMKAQYISTVIYIAGTL